MSEPRHQGLGPAEANSVDEPFYGSRCVQLSPLFIVIIGE